MLKFGESKKIQWSVLLSLALFISGCASDSTIAIAQLPLQSWTNNFEYRYTLPYDAVSDYLIYYKLYIAEGVTWYYPVTTRSMTNNAPLEAVNLTLQEVCKVLGIPPQQAEHLSLDAQGVATLDLPQTFMPGVKAGNPKRELEALVLTLTEFREVDRVQLLFGGTILSFLGDRNMNDISLPLSRPARYNDNVYYQGQGTRVTLYWRQAQSDYLVPATHVMETGSSIEAELQRLLDLLLYVPETQRGIASNISMLRLNSHLESPLTPIWDESKAPPKLSLRQQTLQISLEAATIEPYLGDPALVRALSALTRTFLALGESKVKQVQFLIDDRLMNLTFDLFSLSEPLYNLPFINFEARAALD